MAANAKTRKPSTQARAKQAQAARRPKIRVHDAGPDVDPSQRYRTTLVATNGRNIVMTCEGYSRKARAVETMEDVAVNGKYATAVVVH